MFTYITANDPYSGVGIAIHACTGVNITHCNFDHMYLGIAGISTSTDVENLDGSSNIFIKFCTGSECGFLKPDSTFVAGQAPQRFRGAFIGFQGAQFIGPTLSSPLYHGNIEDSGEEYPSIFQTVVIEDSQAGSSVAQAGIFLNYVEEYTIKRCTMQLNEDTSVGAVSRIQNASAPFLGYFNHVGRVKDCEAMGGFNSIYFCLGLDEVFEDCVAMYHWNTGMCMIYGQYQVIKRATISEGLGLGAPIAESGNQPAFMGFGLGYGIEFLVQYKGLVEDVSLSNYRSVSRIQTTTNYNPLFNNYQDAIGMNTSISSYCTVRRVNAFDNAGGFLFFPSDHCTFQDNVAWANGTDLEPGGLNRAVLSSGFVLNEDYFSGPPVPLGNDPLRFNKYIGNRMMNNGQNGNCNVLTSASPSNSAVYAIGMPFLVTSVFQNPLIPLPVNANIQETPSIFLRSDYNFLAVGLGLGFGLLQALSTTNVTQGTNLTFLVDVWQGVASSTRPITGYVLNTPARDPLAIPVGPSPVSITLNNIQPADVGYYSVTVTFDIASPPALTLPALPTYDSNTFSIDRVVP